MSRYVLTPQADQDLVDIWEYIAQHDIVAADRWDSKLRDAFKFLSRNPGAGHVRQDLTDLPVLFWRVGAYLILYRVKNKHLEIVAVTQGSRNIPSFLQSRS
jgi:plasmid stabilization system protein ParE